jgi:hypothetical protein
MNSDSEIPSPLFESLQQAPAVAETARPLAIKMAMPEKFNGSRALYRGFINQLNLLFMVNATTYSTDAIKIAVLASYLTGPALTWFNPYLENQAAHAVALSSYVAFCLEMDSFFQPIDRSAMAAMKLNDLAMKPGQSVSDFASIFLQLSAEVDWNEAALMNRFELGLSSAVADMMVMHNSAITLKEMMTLAIKLDGRLRLHQQQRNQRRNQPFVPQRPIQDRLGPRVHDRLGQKLDERLGPRPNPVQQPRYVPPASDAMEIDAATVVRRGPLTQEERDERMRKGLCLVCGKDGHLKLNCPLRRNIAGMEVFQQGQ